MYEVGNTPPRQDTERAKEEQKREKKHLDSVREKTKKAARKGKGVLLDGMEAVADAAIAAKNAGSRKAGDESDEEGDALEGELASVKGSSGLRRTRTHYADSAVAPVWHELNSD